MKALMASTSYRYLLDASIASTKSAPPAKGSRYAHGNFALARSFVAGMRRNETNATNTIMERSIFVRKKPTLASSSQLRKVMLSTNSEKAAAPSKRPSSASLDGLANEPITSSAKSFASAITSSGALPALWAVISMSSTSSTRSAFSRPVSWDPAIISFTCSYFS